MSAMPESQLAAVPALPQSLDGDPVVVQIAATEVNVSITFQFNETTHLWHAASDHETITAGVGERLLITWTLIPPQEDTALFFDDPGIVFPDWQIPAPFLLVDDPAGFDRRRIVALWTNVDVHRQSKSFRYRLNAIINGQAIIHDPKVENDPPT